MPGDAPTPAAGSSIWNNNGLLDPASLWHSSLMAPPTMNGDPLNSRLFVVCGKSIEADTLSEAFARFGHIQSVRLVRDKGVAYVKYDKASSAAAAIEALHETSLCDGRGPMLKVMVAEAPTRRSGTVTRQPETDIAADPDNIPPRSRLFMVVPKTADGSIIEGEMSKFRDLEYCKIDLIAAKGIVFVKYAKSSSALLALESILANDCMVSDYKVKVMIAEPKGKRGRRDPLFSDAFAHAIQQPGLEYGGAQLGPYSPMSTRRYTSQGLPASALHSLTDTRSGSGSLANSLANGYPQAHSILPQHEQHMEGVPGNYGMGSSMPGHGHGLGSYSSLSNSNGLSLDRSGNWRQEDGSSEAFGMSMNIAQIQAMAADLGARTLGQAIANQGMTHGGNIGSKHPGTLLNGISEEGQDTSAFQSPMHMEQMASHSLTRLYLVVSKAVTEETLEYLFGVFEGLEYVDLKRDHASGLSRGFAYVKYNNSISAASAVERYNGFELPAGSGLRLKVMYAENLQVRQGGGKGTPPLLPSRSLSARSDSTSSILQPRSGDMISPGVQSTNMGRNESTPDLRDARYAEVAAIQNSLAHMTMPHHSDLAAYGHSTPPPNRGQRSPLLSPSGMQPDQETSTWVHLPVPEGDKDESADSGPAPPHMIQSDDYTLFTELSRPMPDYALEHVFAQHGPIEWVRLRPDERYGVVRFGTGDAVQFAIDALHGTKICGEKINVTRMDPLMAPHNSKRLRRAPTPAEHMLSRTF